MKSVYFRDPSRCRVVRTVRARYGETDVGAMMLRHRGWVTARRLIASLAVFAVVAAGLGIAIAVITAKKPPPAPAAPQPLAPQAPRTPTPAEFQLAVVVTDQNCSDPAACIYKYRIEPKYLGLHPLPDKAIKVIYQVTGGQQPQTGDFTVQGGQARVLQDVPLEGPPGARLQASVTQVVG